MINISKETLRKKYEIEKLPTEEIARFFDCSKETISGRVKEFNLKMRSRGNWDGRRIYHFNKNIFKSCDNENKAYWLGFIMADGSVIDDGKRSVLKIQLKIADNKHLEKFRDFLESNYPIYEYSFYSFGKICKTAQITIYSKDLIKDLSQYGIIPRKTGKEQIKNIPFVYMKDFMRGYIDGDGTFSTYISRGKKVSSFSVVCASRKLLEKMNKFLYKNCSLKKLSKICARKSKGHYSLTIGGTHQVRRIHDFLYKNSSVFLERKFLKELD